MRPLPLKDREHLQPLGFQRFAPHPYLQPWVQCYWVLHAHIASRTENLYPDGGTSLVIDFAAADLPMQFSASQQLHQLPLHGHLDRLGIRFHPGGAFQLLGLAMNELSNCELSLAALGLARPLLQEQLFEAKSLSARLQLIECWLLQESQQVQAQQGLVQQLLPLLSDAHCSIEELSHRATISRRQLERKFQQQVGLSPNKLKQLLRVKQVRQLINQAPTRSLTQLAVDLGFYDQAHFIRQFQQVTGQTPGQYRQRKLSQKYN